MNKTTKIIRAVNTGVIAALATFAALLLTGLGTTGLRNYEGDWVSLTTVKLDVTEFGLLMIFVVLITVIVTSYAFSFWGEKKTSPEKQTV